MHFTNSSWYFTPLHCEKPVDLTRRTLKKLYKILNESGKNLQVIFVSADSTLTDSTRPCTTEKVRLPLAGSTPEIRSGIKVRKQNSMQKISNARRYQRPNCCSYLCKRLRLSPIRLTLKVANQVLIELNSRVRKTN